MLGMVILLASYLFLGDRLKQAREASRPLPPANLPNVLMIVLDTVRADHLSLYGYERSTTPVSGATRKARGFVSTRRTTAPWTLPSHASMFTGRWPHEQGEEWMTPIRGNFPTLAEYLGNHGYATAGFVGNVGYCSQETGLARGFTHYEDYLLEDLDSIRTFGLVEYLAAHFSGIIRTLDIGSLRPLRRFVNDWIDPKRKNASMVGRAFLRWVSQRRDARRPFFAFLNLFDAHAAVPTASRRTIPIRQLSRDGRGIQSRV